MCHDIKQCWPLTEFQLQLWAGQQLNPASPLYVMALAVTIDTALCPQRLQTAWRQLQAAEPALVARIEKHDGQWLQCAACRPAEMAVVDFSTAPDAESAARLNLQQDSEQAFDLGGDLTLCRLLKIADERWIWMIKQHHVITDAWSFSALWRQLEALYSGSLTADTLTIEPFSHYVADARAGDASSIAIEVRAEGHAAARPAARTAENTVENSVENDETGKHWQAQLPDQPLVLFASDTRRATTEAPRQALAFDDTRRAALSSLSALPSARSFNAQLSNSVVLMTVLTALLARLSGDQRITLGVPVANRRDERFANTPGLFVEVLPLGVEVAEDATFNSLATTVRTALMSHLRYARPGACAFSKPGLVNVVFNYINVALVPFGQCPVQVEWLHPGHADQQHALRLQVSDWTGSGQLSLAFDTNKASFPGKRAALLEQHWWRLFEAMQSDPTQGIAAVPLVTASESDWLASADMSNAWPASVSRDLLLDRLQCQVQAQPGRRVLVPAGADAGAVPALSYRELDEQSNALALALHAQSIGPGQHVAVFQRRSPALVVSLLGIMKCGAAYVPIDRTTPTSRAAWIVDDAKAAAVISTPDMPALNCDVPVLHYADVMQQGEAASSSPLPVSVTAEATAYLLYTSGSTGQPKGVCISHGALANYLGWAAHYYTQGQALCFPLFTPVGFDLTVTSLFVPLITGGTLHIYPDSATPGDVGLLEVIADNAVDIIKLTPAHLAMLQGVDVSQSRVRQLIVGGEDLKQAQADRIQQSFGRQLLIHNEYGPTECTVGCVVHTASPNDAARSVPIGKPVSGVQLRVLNAALQVQPPGVAGELYLGGASLADGYWQRDVLNREVFISGSEPSSARWYKTGDLVRHDEQGRLVYLGRVDSQVKVQGVRVELAEIEAASLAVPGVSQCVVTVLSASERADEELFCARCGLSSRYPEARMDEHQICDLCRQFEQYEQRARSYFRPMHELDGIIDDVRQRASGDYDCIMLLSGGKDSSYALARLVDYGLKILAFTLDNGFISEGAKANIARVCQTLGVDHRYGETPHMNTIFADSLARHSNVCNGCFKVVYTLSLALADELSIPTIITGLSRGQFFETRLTEELFTAREFDIKIIDETVLSTRKAYHQSEDAVSRCMDVEHVRDPALFDRVKIIDFYRYCDVNLDEMYRYLDKRVPWIRPVDTGRSTNCLINDVGIHVHRQEQGYHNYSLPYSWDVRLGHKRRDEALDELDDDINEDYVAEVLEQIGYTLKTHDEAGADHIVLYYTADNVSPVALRQHLQQRLPAWMLPACLVPLKRFILTDNGKLDRAALPAPGTQRQEMSMPYRAPRTPNEHWLAELWCELLKRDCVGMDDNFFELNGDSLTAIRMVARITAQGHTCSVTDLFEAPTVALLAAGLQSARMPAMAEAAPAAAFDALDAGQFGQLAAALASQTASER